MCHTLLSQNLYIISICIKMQGTLLIRIFFKKKYGTCFDSYLFDPILSAIAATSPAPFPLPSSLKKVVNLQEKIFQHIFFSNGCRWVFCQPHSFPSAYFSVYFSKYALKLGCSLYSEPVTAMAETPGRDILL